MTRAKLTVLLIVATAVAMSGQGRPAAVATPDLSGIWTLNRGLSQFPSEVGFGRDVVPSSPTEVAGIDEGGRSGNPRSLTARPQTEEVARNTQQLVNELKDPSTRLVIVQTATAVAVTDTRGRTRTFRTDGRDEPQNLDAGPVTTATRWEGARLVVRYKVEPGREIRYTLSRKAGTPQLLVLADLIERGGRDTITRVYDPGKPSEPAPPPSELPALPSQRVAETPRLAPPTTREAAQPAVPAVGGAPQAFDQRRDAELIGLTSLGLVVEGVGPEAEHCGVKQAQLETAAAKSLAEAGLRVVRNTDNDTYLYINVNSTAMSTGFCFTRYDAHIYTHTTATMSYGARPVLVQVSLLHKGGLTGSGASSHGEAVSRTIKQYVDQLAARVRDANK